MNKLTSSIAINHNIWFSKQCKKTPISLWMINNSRPEQIVTTSMLLLNGNTTQCKYYTTKTDNNKTTNDTMSSVKNQEITFFNQLAKDWWNPEGAMKPLHRMNPIRVKYILNQLQQKQQRQQQQQQDIDIQSNNQKITERNNTLKGVNIIDVGCGAGLLTESLTRLGGNVTGLDAASNNIEMAIVHANQDRTLKSLITTGQLKYVNSTIEQYAMGEGIKNGFDVVCSLEVIEHVDNVPEFLQQLSLVLKPGGSLFISTINKTLLSYLSSIVAAEYILKLVPIGTHHYDQYISPSTVEQLLKQNNINVIDCQGLIYNPISSNWSIQPSFHQVNYILHAIKK